MAQGDSESPVVTQLVPLMSWSRGLLQVQNYIQKKNVLKYTITAAAVFGFPQNVTLDTQQNGWNTAGSH